MFLKGEIKMAVKNPSAEKLLKKDSSSKSTKTVKSASDEYTYEIVKHIGVLKEGKSGWRKELNLVKWNGAKNPAWDIRSWQRDEEGNIIKVGKGISLSDDEARILSKLIQDNF